MIRLRRGLVPCLLSATLTASFAARAAEPLRITQGPTVEGAGDTWAVIAWSTNTGGGTSLHYGTDRDHLGQTAEAPYAHDTHRVHLTHLKPGTTYFFRAVSIDGQGTGTTANSGLLTFTTAPGGSTAPLKAAQAASTAGPIVQRLRPDEATIWWQPPAGVRDWHLAYGPAAGVLRAASSPGANAHDWRLTGLTPAAEYRFVISDAAGRTLAQGRFRTPDAGTPSAPRIVDGPALAEVSDTEAVVAWKTSAASGAVVRYGTDPDALAFTAQAPWGSDTHRVVVGGLRPGTHYYFVAESPQVKGAGTALRSAEGQFTTLPAGSAALRFPPSALTGSVPVASPSK